MSCEIISEQNHIFDLLAQHNGCNLNLSFSLFKIISLAIRIIVNLKESLAPLLISVFEFKISAKYSFPQIHFANLILSMGE